MDQLVKGKPAPMRRTSITGEWRVNGDKPGTAGGCPKHASFFDNPQFVLDLSGLQQEVTVTLSQAQLGGKSGGLHPIGFVVLTAPDKQGRTRRKSLGAPGGPMGYKAIVEVCPAAFAAQEQVSANIVLERDDGPYILVPCTAEPSCQATFALEVRSNFGLSVRALPRKGSLPENSLLEAKKENSNPNEADQRTVAMPRGLGGKGYGFPLGGEGGEEEAAALVAKLAPGKLYGEAASNPNPAPAPEPEPSPNPHPHAHPTRTRYEDTAFFGDVALYGAALLSDRGGAADRPAEPKVSWRRANELVGGGGGWGAQLDTLSDDVLLPPSQWAERGGVGASAATSLPRAGAAAGAAEMAGA